MSSEIPLPKFNLKRSKTVLGGDGSIHCFRKKTLRGLVPQVSPEVLGLLFQAPQRLPMFGKLLSFSGKSSL